MKQAQNSKGKTGSQKYQGKKQKKQNQNCNGKPQINCKETISRQSKKTLVLKKKSKWNGYSKNKQNGIITDMNIISVIEKIACTY